jgi:hypothetical protein
VNASFYLYFPRREEAEADLDRDEFERAVGDDSRPR